LLSDTDILPPRSGLSSPRPLREYGNVRYHTRMWPFTRRFTESKEAEDRLGTLSRRLDDCESKVRMLTGEWTDTLDRIDRQVGRLAKRQARDAVAAEVGPQDQANGHGPLDEVELRRSRTASPTSRGSL